MITPEHKYQITNKTQESLGDYGGDKTFQRGSEKSPFHEANLSLPQKTNTAANFIIAFCHKRIVSFWRLS